MVAASGRPLAGPAAPAPGDGAGPGDELRGSLIARSAVDRPQITLPGAPDDFLAARRDDPLAPDEECPVDPVVFQGVEALHDPADGRRVEGDVVRIAVHEGDLARVHADLGL